MPSLGSQGEAIALDHLLKQGYSLLYKNFRTRYGEIDLIVKKNNLTVFVEVKTRANTLKGEPYEAITYRKRLHMVKVAKYFLLNKNTTKLRFDAISITLNGEKKDIKHFENIPVDDLV